MTHERQYVFGFGSLVDVATLARFLGRAPFAASEFIRCGLCDHRRAWNIARDNRRDFPGRPHYICAETGARPAVFVTVVNIRPHRGHVVNGVAFAVTPLELARLDRREAVYDRISVTGAMDVTLSGPVWAYRGKAASESCYSEGQAAGTAVISRDYHDRVAAAFTSHGADYWDAYQASTDPPAVPLRELRRVTVAMPSAAG